MPFVEQMLYGQESSTSRQRIVLTQSPGLGQSVISEIRQLCEGWGDLPLGGLARPVVLSVPLQKTMETQRGRIYAVVHLSPGHDTLFHAVVISEADYVALGHNPFALARSFTFVSEWRDGILLDRVEFDAAADASLVSPPPSRTDMALVCESLRHILVQKQLHLPIGQPEEGSDRTLALIIASLPTPMRRDLRFASFAGSERGGFQLAALATDNCQFSGWQRLLLTQVAAIVPDEVEQYVSAIGSYLAAGDLPGVCRLAREQFSLPGGAAAKARVDNARRGTAVPTEARSRQPINTKVPMRAHSVIPLVPTGNGPGSGGTTPPRRRSRPGRTRSGASRRSVPPPARRRSGGSRIFPLVIAGSIIAALFWWRMPDVTRLAQEKLGWSPFADTAKEDKHTSTLLSVIDVGEVYESLVRRVAKAGVVGEGNVQRDRRASLLKLQTDAAAPLLEQLDLFVALSNEGIQQATRPDREKRRLHALDEQGVRLEQEMSRLELAWHSLASGTDWQDLSRLDDNQVADRRDSLRHVAKPALVECGMKLGTTEARGSLRVARRRVDGMTDLIDLMWQREWSRKWEKEVAAAAGLVSPRASAATRAYRNSAFAFVRLKQAERSTAAIDLPFGTEFEDGAWPAREVRDVLPELRNEVSRFGRGDTPPVLKATLELYARLEQCATLARDAAADDVLARLSANPAVVFDPTTYENYLERIRFEAVRGLLESAPDSTDIPAHLYSGDDSLGAYRFIAVMADSAGAQQWRQEQELQSRPFLARWAQFQQETALRSELTRQRTFDADWISCLESVSAMQERVAAGGDWTAAWLDLRENVVSLLDDYARLLGGDRERAAKLQRAASMVQELDAPRELSITSVTVRLQGDVLPGGECVVELHRPDGSVLRGDTLNLGPAAPGDAGRVGTVALDWNLSLAANEALAVVVRDAVTGDPVIEADYPALRDRVGPGALLRPRGEDTGTVAFKLAPTWWSSLSIQELE